MKYPSLLGRARLVVLSLIFVSTAVAGVGLWRARAGQRMDAAEMKRAFHERLRAGVGSEVIFAGRGADAHAVRGSVNSLDQFIFSRSSVRLDGQTKDKLADMEARVLAGEARRLTPDALGQLLTATLNERISTLTDDEIAHAAHLLRGFDAPGLPATFRGAHGKLRLRASKAAMVTPAQFIAQAKAIRDADGAAREVFNGTIQYVVRAEIAGRVKYLGEALPEQFGNADTVGVTPLQAVLLVYAVAADDLLSDSRAQLRERMRASQAQSTRISGEPYPSPDGHYAYGPNGYMYSTPLDLVLGESLMARLLTRMDERSTSR